MAVIILNAICSTVSILIILSGLSNLPVGYYFMGGIFTCLTDVLINVFISPFSLVFRICANFLVLFFFKKSISSSLFLAVTAETVVTCTVFAAGPVFFYLLADPNVYNYIMCIFIIMSAICFRQYTKRKEVRIVLSKKLAYLSVMMELLIIVPITSLNWEIIGSSWFVLIVTSLLVIITVLIAVLFYFIMKAELELKETKIHQESETIQRKLIEENYREEGWRFHFTAPAIGILRKCIENNDMEGIVRLYDKYVVPLNKEFMSNKKIDMLTLIKLPLIYNLLYDLFVRLPDVQLVIDSEIDIDNSIILETDLFIILSEFINNAVEHANSYKDRYVYIYMSKDSTNYYIEIENPYKDHVVFEKIYQSGYSGKRDHTGFGLSFIKEILDKYRNIKHQTYIKQGNFVQALIIETRMDKDEEMGSNDAEWR